MIDIAIANRLGMYGVEAALAGIRLWAIRNHWDAKQSAKALMADGWVRAEIPVPGLPSVTAHGQVWVRKRTPKAPNPYSPSVPGESLSSVLCPACQSVMAKSPICPNCSKGKAGFKILCQCTECGHEVYL